MAYPIFNDEQRWGDITKTPSWKTPSSDKLKKDKSYLAARSRAAAVMEFLPNEQSTASLDAQRTKAMPSSTPQPFRIPTAQFDALDPSAPFRGLTSGFSGNTKVRPSANTRPDISATSPDINAGFRSMGGLPSNTSSGGIRIPGGAYGNLPSKGQIRTRRSSGNSKTPSNGGVFNDLSRSLEFYHALTRHSEGGNAEILRAYQVNRE